MAAREDNPDDEMELINAEFESMVADLNLDQSSPRTYLDDLDDLEAAEKSERNQLYYPEHVKRGFHGGVQNIIESIKRWWQKPPRDDSDGAVV